MSDSAQITRTHPALPTAHNAAIQGEHDALVEKAHDEGDDFSHGFLFGTFRDYKELLERRTRLPIDVELDLDVAIGSDYDREALGTCRAFLDEACTALRNESGKKAFVKGHLTSLRLCPTDSEFWWREPEVHNPKTTSTT